MAIDPTTGLEVEEEDQYYPGALPGPNRQQLGAIRDKYFNENVDLLQSSGMPGFENLQFDGGGQAAGGWDEEVVVSGPAVTDDSGWDEEVVVSGPAPEEEERGFFNNTARVAAQRALQLAGSTVRGIGEIGQDLDSDTGRFVWDDGIIPSWYSPEEFKELEKQGVTANLLTEIIPRAFQERDLGGEKRHTPDNIKEAWANGDVSGVASATAKFIGETGIESIADMLAVVYSLPLYITGRSQEIAEERVRNRRLSEALAEDATLSPQAQNDIATGYVSDKDVGIIELGNAAPFAALSASLERIGAKGIGNAGKEVTEQIAGEATEAGFKAVLKEGGRAAGKEAGTEFFQEGVIEYIGEKIGTSGEGLFANLSAGEGFERGAFGALAGGGAGGVAGTAIAAGRQFMVDPDTGEVDTGTTPPDVPNAPVRPDVASEAESFETTQGGFSDAERTALENQLDNQAGGPEQGSLDLPPSPAPTPNAATPSPSETAPVTAGPEPTPVAEAPPVQGSLLDVPAAPVAEPAPVDEVVTADDLVTEPAPVEEAPAPVENPMIQKKDVEAGFRALSTRTKAGMPGIRKAIKSLATTIAGVFPNTKALPGMKGTVGPKRIGEYFATLDEEIKIDETLPNLKGFLQAVYDSPDAASAVQNINRLKEYIANSGAGVVDSGTIAPTLAGAVQGITLYDTFEADRAAGTKKYTTKDKEGKPVERTTNRSKENKPQARAVAIDELATVVKSLIEQASAAGINVPAEVNELILRARSYRSGSEVVSTTVSKGGAGSKKTNYKFNRKNLNEVGGKLREAAQTLVEQLAANDTQTTTETSTTPKKAKGEPKAEETPAVTEAPAKPKKAEAAKKTSQAKKKAEPVEEGSNPIPKKYRGGGYFFHTVRDDADIASIQEEGLRKGTNVSREGGQGTEEEGGTILVFKDEGNTEGKGYQADEVITKPGAKPIAIIKDTSVDEQEAGTGDEAGAAYEVWEDNVADIADNWGVDPGKIFTALATLSLKKNPELRKEGWSAAQIPVLRRLEREQESLFKDAERADQPAVTQEDVLEKYKDTGLPVEATIEEEGGTTVTSKNLLATKSGLFAVEESTQPVTRESMGKVSKGGMSDVFKTSTEVAVEEGIARDLNSLVEDADKIEKAGGMDTSYEGGYAAYNLSGVFTGGHVTKADMTNLKQPQLRKIAKAIGAKTASKKTDLIDNIFAAAEREVSRVEAETAAMEATSKKPEVKVTTKKSRKIANPDKVIEVEAAGPVLTGRQAANFAEDVGTEAGTGATDRALEAANIPKKTAGIVRAIIEKAPVESRRRIIDAIKSYRGPADNLELVTNIFEAVGGEVEAGAMAELLSFAESHAQNKAADPVISAEEEILAEEAAANGMSLEDWKTVKRDTGQYVEDTDTQQEPGSDEFFDMSVDEYNNSQHMTEGNMPEGARQSGGELARALVNAKTGLLGFMAKFTKLRGFPDPGPTNVNDMLKAIIKSLPSNNRYVPLAKRLLELDLQVPVYIYGERMEGDGDKLLGSYYPGNNFDPDDRRIRLFLDDSTDPRHIFSTALHEIVHAATLAGYENHAMFRSDIDAMYDRAVIEMDREFPGWRDKGATTTSTFYGMSNPVEFIAEAMTNPRFQHWLSSIDSIQTLRQKKKSFVGATGLMRRFINRVKKYLGYSIRNSLLEDVILLVDDSLSTENEVLIQQQQIQVRNARYRWKAGDTKSEVVPKFEGDIEATTGQARTHVKQLLDAGLITANESSRMNRRIDQINTGENLGTKTTKAQQAKLRAIVAGIARPVIHAKKKTRDQSLDAQRQLKTGIAGIATKIKDAVKTAGQQVNLAFSNRDVIERNNRDLFDSATESMGMENNALTRYTKLKNSASALARKYERMGYLMLKRVQALTNSARSELGTHMRDITKANIDPTQPLNSAANAHIWTKKGKLRKAYVDIAPQARSNYLNFRDSNPEAAKLLADMAALTKEIHDTKVRSALFALGEIFGFDTPTLKALQKAKTAADVDAIIDPAELTDAKAKVENLKGKKKYLKQELASAQARAEAAKSAKKIIADSSIKGWYFPLRRYGNYVVSTGEDVKDADKYVSFHSTQAEATRVANALNDEAGTDGNRVSVSLKIRKGASTSDMSSVIADLGKRIKDKPTRNKLMAAMTEVMAANAAYQSQLKRANVDGVAADDMARAFEEYVHVSKYSIGDLLTAHKVSKSIQDMVTLQANRNDDLDPDTAIKVGLVVDEIKQQNLSDVTDREMSTVQKTVGIVGFLNFLGAPSYWVLNATQTYTVTLPYVTAKFGVKAPLRLAAAQKQVLGAVGRALASSDKSYEGFKAQLPAAAQRVVAQLEAEGIIQSTIAHEFGDMLSPTAMNKMREHALGAPVAKTTEFALQILEKVPEAVEHYNRISTALAIYEMSDGDITATVDGVQATQFNYDTGNRARLLKTFPGGGGRGLITPVMMFKTYGIGLMRLFYGAALDVAFKKGGRTEAMKLAAGLITTHTMFGGVAGGLMLGPVMMLQSLANAMFKEPDDEWDLEEALALWGEEIGGDTLATLIKKGLPSALGIDLSRSVNLGNLLYMSNENLDPAKYGDIERGLFQVAGPVAQYGVTAWREGYRVLTGNNDASMAEFLEAAIPLKAYRGMSRAVRYNIEGLQTSGELTMLTPEEFTQTIQTAVGFQPVQKTNVQGEYYDDVRLDMKRSARKSSLVERANNAIMSGDFDKVADIFDDIQGFNASVPKPANRITPGDMAQLRGRLRTAQRDYNKKYRYSN